MPEAVVACFKAQGALWGGDYHGRTDPMHFEFCSREAVAGRSRCSISPQADGDSDSDNETPAPAPASASGFFGRARNWAVAAASSIGFSGLGALTNWQIAAVLFAFLFLSAVCTVSFIICFLRRRAGARLGAEARRMMGDLFWDVATSYPVLSILALLLVAAFVVAHVPVLVERFIPAIAPYVALAALLQVLAAALLFFLIGFRIADERADNKQLKNDLAYHQLQLESAEATAKDAERLKAEAEARANEAKGKLDEYRTIYGDDPGTGCGFTADDIERLRELQRAKPR
jgi:hypothetical protein